MATVGIPLGLDDRGRWRRDRDYHYLDAAYARALEAAGVVPVYLPVQRNATAALDGVEALLIPGGGDFAPPERYPPGVPFELVPEAQLAFDRALLRAALERRLPVLAICYGMQLLALEVGGRLHYDLASDCPEASEHQLGEGEETHAVEVVAGTKLAELTSRGSHPVNSRHHQAVADPGQLRVCARSSDGVIEAIDSEGPTFLLGVQWHPESMAGPLGQGLFEALAATLR